MIADGLAPTWHQTSAIIRIYQDIQRMPLLHELIEITDYILDTLEREYTQEAWSRGTNPLQYIDITPYYQGYDVLSIAVWWLYK